MKNQSFFILFCCSLHALFLAISCLWPVRALAAADSSKVPNRRNSVLLCVFAAPVFGVESPGFARAYSAFGPPPFSFDSPLSLGAIGKTLVGSLRVGVSVEAYRARFQDNYQQTTEQSNAFGEKVPGFRSIYQDFTVKVLPVFATVEVVPVRAQFHTYAGMGVGAAYVAMYWNESVRYSNPSDKRKGGLYVDEVRVVPAARLYAGIELGFDRIGEKPSLLNSLFVETRYSFIPASLPLLQRIAPQMDSPPAGWDAPVGVQTGGFSLAMGITLHFRQ